MSLESRHADISLPRRLPTRSEPDSSRCASRESCPTSSLTEEYALEYGTNSLEIHADAIVKGERVLVVDDVLATGGTARATARLLERLGASVEAFAFLVELTALRGREADCRRGDRDLRFVLKHEMRFSPRVAGDRTAFVRRANGNEHGATACDADAIAVAGADCRSGDHQARPPAVRFIGRPGS